MGANEREAHLISLVHDAAGRSDTGSMANAIMVSRRGNPQRTERSERRARAHPGVIGGRPTFGVIDALLEAGGASRHAGVISSCGAIWSDPMKIRPKRPDERSRCGHGIVTDFARPGSGR
jgi:hypothetical protein